MKVINLNQSSSIQQEHRQVTQIKNFGTTSSINISSDTRKPLRFDSARQADNRHCQVIKTINIAIFGTGKVGVL
ncbi:MAG: hypothetical protein HWD63_09540 [Candidatus Parvibacillus calidus]|nr:MAG: hypothetical protein HWD63_09540 [Candidatus Parvibacillus calidus]